MKAGDTAQGCTCMYTKEQLEAMNFEQIKTIHAAIWNLGLRSKCKCESCNPKSCC